MGCASSSPLVAANGGILNAAKGAATDAVHAGEEALHDVKETINDTVGHVKEAVVGAVNSVGHGIENAFNGRRGSRDEIQDIGVMDKPKSDDDENTSRRSSVTHIPLKGAKDQLDKTLDDLADTINAKAKEFEDDTEKMTDELIKETEDVVNDASHTVASAKDNVTSKINHVLKGSPVHSIDSLKTDSSEPEIENALANSGIANPPTPKPNISELEKLQSDFNVSNSLTSDVINSNPSTELVATAIAVATNDSANNE